jgi:hypothetical protein
MNIDFDEIFLEGLTHDSVNAISKLLSLIAERIEVKYLGRSCGQAGGQTRIRCTRNVPGRDYNKDNYAALF